MSSESRATAIDGNDALAAVAISALLFVVVGSALLPLGNLGIAGTELLAFALPALLIAKSKLSPTTALALVRPGALMLLGTLLIGVSLWYWNVHWIAPISAKFGSAQKSAEWSQIVAVNLRPLWESILLFALLPAFCEELLHRGIVAPALAKHLGMPAAILMSALIFGLSHLSLARLLPTAVLGGFAAYLRLRSGSLWPAILLHFLYNSCLLTAAHLGWQLPENGAIPCALVSIVGVYCVFRSPGGRPVP